MVTGRSAPDVWLIAGPTASGKSSLALALAETTGAVIINADSMQVYRDLRVLTARPSEAEEARAPHRLYGVAHGADPWSVGRWSRAALQEIELAGQSASPVIVVGGTGLYFRALTAGLAEMPAVPLAAREEAAAEYDVLGEAAFREQLAREDPGSAQRIAPGDRQRLVRAFSVLRATGRPLGDWQSETRPLLPRETWSAVVLEPPRRQLYARCDARLAAMIEHGAVEEAAALLARGLPPGIPVTKAVGVREFASYLRGEASLEEATARAAMETRRYAKRQTTWFRNQAPEWPRITSLQLDERLAAALAVLLVR